MSHCPTYGMEGNFFVFMGALMLGLVGPGPRYGMVCGNSEAASGKLVVDWWMSSVHGDVLCAWVKVCCGGDPRSLIANKN